MRAAAAGTSGFFIATLVMVKVLRDESELEQCLRLSVAR